MTILFTADQHLGHANVLEYDRRPFETIEDHDEALIANWNRVVGSKDEVYLLGDLCWTLKKDVVMAILEALSGRIYLIRGNHDFKAILNFVESARKVVRVDCLDKKGKKAWGYCIFSGGVVTQMISFAPRQRREAYNVD